MKVEVVREIRFAVVMYGGVSLAIYINGVAQELLRMVRATAIDDNGEFLFADEFSDVEKGKNINQKEKLDQTEQHYRTLARLLGDTRLMEKFAPQIKDKKSWETVQKKLCFETNSRSSVKIVRFVVDILSGSSAGGINAIYLSKAMVCGQNINTLQELWIKEGNFSALLNDQKSLEDTNLVLIEKPPSLFNSQRMYLRLLEAFEKMDKESQSQASLINEVDLFVTLTDFWGMPIHLKLFDKIIYERNHRRRLYFKYRKNRAVNTDNGIVNDFSKENYPFLAYAARCTSSFPVAFEPMKLSDTTAVLKTMGRGRAVSRTWKTYFPQERMRKKGNQTNWKNRVFVDGGTLDNKPFGYAIEAIGKKQADVLIDRKLIYIEPKPDLDGGNERIKWSHRPSAFKNTLDIVTALPGYETIREDLQRVLERNRLIGKVAYLVSNARKDEYNLLNLVKDDLKTFLDANALSKTPRQNSEWVNMTLAEVARNRGQAVYSYYRLRMSALTDDLARMSTRRAGVEDGSDVFLAIRRLVRAWRLKYYNKDENPEKGETILSFLYHYDFNYRLRRLRFVLQEADRLLSALERLKTDSFATLGEKELQTDKFSGDLKRRYDLTRKLLADRDFQTAVRSKEAQTILRQRFPLIEEQLFESAEQFDTGENSNRVPIIGIFESKKEELRIALHSFKKTFYRHLKELEHRQQLIETRLIDTELEEHFVKLNAYFSNAAKKLSPADIAEILGEKDGEVTSGHDDIEAGDQVGAQILERNSGELDKEISQIALTLRHIYNGGDGIKENKSLFGKVRSESEKLFGLDKNKIKSAEKSVRLYLRHFYNNFDGYDQMIFPITYETPVGEGDIIEVARISPADAVNLIDEAVGDPPKKKLAGDTFFSFSAFFHENWRKNDIMWGRLDAAERLCELITSDTELDDDTNKKKIIITEIQRQILTDNSSFLNSGKTEHNIDYIEFIRKEYQANRRIDESAVMQATARALAVTAQILQSPNEAPPGEIYNKNKPSLQKTLTKVAADLIHSSGCLIEISATQFSLKNLFSFLASPFKLGYIFILLLVLLVPLIISWLIIFNALRIFGVWENRLLSEVDILWLGGIVFVISGFYISLGILMQAIKHFLLSFLKEKIEPTDRLQTRKSSKNRNFEHKSSKN